jgi:hypothetical protein
MCLITHHTQAAPTHIIIAGARWRLSKKKMVDVRIDRDKFVSVRYFDGSICQPANKNTTKLKGIHDKGDLEE